MSAEWARKDAVIAARRNMLQEREREAQQKQVCMGTQLAFPMTCLHWHRQIRMYVRCQHIQAWHEGRP